MTSSKKKQIGKQKVIKNHKPLYNLQISVILPLLTVLGFLLYGNTIRNDYTFDDGIVILNNDFTKQGIAGIDDIFKHDSFYGEPSLRNTDLVAGGRYRPLSIATFALEYQFFKNNPHVSHFINILILIMTVFLIYRLIDQYISPAQSKKWYLSIAFITALIFLVHPVHTESVANIKGRDDLLCLLFCIIAAIISFRFFATDKTSNLLVVFVTLFAALLSKESAITFVAIIPLMIYFFEKNTSSKKYYWLFATLIASATSFIVLRSVVLPPFNSTFVQDLISNSFIEATTSQKYATIALTLGYYLKLLILPFPLTYDYYPYFFNLADWTNASVIVSVTVWIILLILAFVFFRKKSIVSFSILYFIVTISLVSNILFPIGVFMNERFLYMPSLGFCLFVAWFFVNQLPLLTGKYYLYVKGIFVIGLVLFSYKTISRNKDWESNFTLFSTDVVTSSNSIKSNYDYAIVLSEEAEKAGDKETKEQLYEKSLQHLRKALQIYPKYAAALATYADISFKYQNNVDTTIFYYEKALVLNPKMKKIYNTLGTLYGQYKADYGRAIVFFEKDIEQNGGTSDTYKKLSMCYIYLGDTVKALGTAHKGLKLNPKDLELVQMNQFLTKTTNQ